MERERKTRELACLFTGWSAKHVCGHHNEWTTKATCLAVHFLLPRLSRLIDPAFSGRQGKRRRSERVLLNNELARSV